MKPTEILLDLSELKLGRIIKKDFEEVIVDISAISYPLPSTKRDPVPKAETFPTGPVPKAETFPKNDTALPAAPTTFSGY